MAGAGAPERGRFLSSLRRQVAEVHRGSLTALSRKAAHVLSALPFLPLILLIRALHPWISVRFGGLNSYRIGHFAINTELYLSQRDLTENKRPGLDLFFLAGHVSNQQLKKMWCRTLPVSRFYRYASVCNDLLPGGKNHIVPLLAAGDPEGVLDKTQPHISFTSEEEQIGLQGLYDLGLPPETPYVCLHARDSGYLEHALPSLEPDRWKYHDHRNSDIQTYISAAENLATMGYFVFRTGVAVKQELHVDNPRIIDYASDGRTDFLDIYLGAKCHFFICDTAGMSSIPGIFRRPIAWLNFIPLIDPPTWSSKDLFIPKKLWSINERRFLTFREILRSYTDQRNPEDPYLPYGTEIVDNTSDEICSLVLEMEGRLAGTWQNTREDDDLQNRFWDLFPSRNPNQALPRIGTHFMRQNLGLLD